MAGGVDRSAGGVNVSDYGVKGFDRVDFTAGECHLLARAIHRKTGWPVCAFIDRGFFDHHAFVRMPDGRYLDVEGVHSERELRKRWSLPRARIGECPPDFLLSEWGLEDHRPYRRRRASVVADRLLAAVQGVAA